MGTRFRDYSPEQPHLLPPAPQDWLSTGHLAYLVRDVVQELDLSAFYRAHQGEQRGAPAFHPTMMVGILMYAWANRVYSSRRIARLCLEDLGGRYLAAGHSPDFRTISLFQLTHGEALADLFVQSVRLCKEAGLVSLRLVAGDGTKVEANASKHKAMSYERMVDQEKQLRREIVELQRRAQKLDAEDDALFGRDMAGAVLPAELKRRDTRLSHIRAAMEALEAEAKAAALVAEAEREAKEREEGKPPRRRKGKPPEEAQPADKAQRSFTDPESRIMKAAGGEFIQAYNGQAAVDGDAQVIVACDLTNQAADAPHFVPLMQQVVENTGRSPEKIVADAGYFSEANASYCPEPTTEVLISPHRLKHGSGETIVLPASGAQSPSAILAARMRDALRTPEGHDTYACRKKIVEPVFGQIKGCPGSPGFFHFLRRGLVKARQEWLWVCATHNILKYLRRERASAQAV